MAASTKTHRTIAATIAMATVAITLATSSAHAEPPSSAAPSGTSSPAEGGAAPPANHGVRNAGWAMIAAGGLVGVGAGILLGYSASQHGNTVQSVEMGGMPSATQVHDTQATATAGVVLGAVAVASLATGITLLLVAPSRAKATLSVTASPRQLVLGGTF